MNAKRGIAILGADETTGDAYKYVEMLRRVSDLTVVRDEHAAAAMARSADFAVVRGDHRSAYTIPLAAGVPYILLEGDVAGMLEGETLREKTMIENAAAVIFNCEGCRDWCAEHYALPPVVETVYLRNLREQLSFDPPDAIDRYRGKTLCYAGGLQPRSRQATDAGYRVYHDIFTAFMRAGWQVHLYTPAIALPRTMREYQTLGCVVHPFVEERRLPKALAAHTAGFQGFNLSGVTQAGRDYIDIAKPNKAWLYLAAGIPTVGYNTGAAARSIYEGRWGVVIDDPSQAFGLPAIDEKIRQREVIDNDIDAFRRLVCSVL